jgi:putative hydrolase of the HAD superfamily
MVIRGVVFDMDDTLFPERDYVHSGFECVARFVATSPEEARGLSAWLSRSFDDGVRGDTFDRMIATYPDLAGRVTVAELVEAYRRHTPSISLLPGLVDLLERLRSRGIRLGVLSDGPLASQQAKAVALALDLWFDPVVLTASRHESFVKPGTSGFEWIADTWHLSPEELVYVADNPLKDFIGPRHLGWHTIRLRFPQQLRFGVDPVCTDDRADVDVADPAGVWDSLVTMRLWTRPAAAGPQWSPGQ